MRQRTKTDIRILRPTGQIDGQLIGGTMAVVPITAKSRRKFTLMSEDSITLSFSLARAVHFAIGDYVDDELFGRFFLQTEQMPKYNKATGGYDYELTFVAPCMLWRNWLHCLVADGKRMEASWTLTDRLAVHAQQVVANLDALGIEGYTLDITATNAAEVHCLTYNGTDILAALNQIAAEWSCEWWVTESDKTIHFGKCEDTDGELLTLQLGDNVESMDIARNQNTYATRLYAYGGTQNIPEDYDRKLIFTADGNDGNEWWDNNRPLTQDMADTTGESLIPLTIGALVEATSGTTKTLTATSTDTYQLSAAGGRIGGAIAINILNNVTSGVEYTLAVNLYATGTLFRTLHTESGTMATPQLARTITLDDELPSNSYTKLEVVVTMTNTGAGTMTITTKDITTTNLAVTRLGIPLALTLTPLGSLDSYPITLNPNGAEAGSEEAGHFVFDDGTPAGFVLGTQYTLEPLSADVPLSYYTSEYNVGTLSKVGERRIHLPLDRYPNRYIEANAPSNPEKMVELAVAFNDIYPRLDLVVSAVRTETRRTKVDHDDGSVSYDNWLRYIIKVTKADGSPFTFDTRYLLSGGERLKAHFLAPATIPAASGALLAGMEFEAGFDNNTQEYTLVRNEDYGVMLPDATLRPQVGDRLFLTGWNPRTIAGLGLVDDAEAELATKAQEYLAAIEQGQFTFTCNMMSDYFFIRSLVRFKESRGLEFDDAAGDDFYVADILDIDMPIAGTRAKVIHAALGGQKTSRVIGYEYKLDKPYDSPILTIGETEAFSRLKQIEKELTKLS